MMWIMRWLVSGRDIEPSEHRGQSHSRPRQRRTSLVIEPSPTVLAADARARLSSLAYTDQTEPSKPPESCPDASDRVIVELYSGETYPDRCRRSQCRYCLPLNARRRCLAITLASPRRMIRLSLLASESDESPCKTALTRVGLIRRNLKRMGLEPGEWCFTIEKNPKGTGYHAHCLQR